MTWFVEISAEGVAGVRADLVATRDGLEALGPLRWRASSLGVSTSGFDEALGIADRLGTSVLPVVDAHLARARALADLRYGGALGPVIPVVDDDPDPFTTTPPYAQHPLATGGTAMTWAAAPAEEQEADEADKEKSQGIGGWFSDRWDDVTEAVDEGTDWVASTASDAWDAMTDIGAEIGDWWESWTAEAGSWVDENLAGVQEWIGARVGVFRFLANACRWVGCALVVAGAILTVALAVVGGLVGFGAGSLLGGVGGVPAGAAAAVAGGSVGVRILVAGFALVSVGDFLDVVADWGEGKIDGQDLVQKGALELGLAITSLIGVGVVGKMLQKGFQHLPPSWRRRIDEWFASRSGSSAPDTPSPAWAGPNGLHLSTDEAAVVDDLLRSAARAEPRITADLRRMLADVDGATMPGLEFRLKGEESLYRKVATDLDDDPLRDVGSSVLRIKDAVRYTAQIPDAGFARGVESVTKELTDAGFAPVSWKNTFGEPGYQGINSAWRSPDGQVFELQFHTPASFDVKMSGHDLYEQLRLPNVSAQERERLEAEMTRQFATVPTPPGVQSITAPEIP